MFMSSIYNRATAFARFGLVTLTLLAMGSALAGCHLYLDDDEEYISEPPRPPSGWLDSGPPPFEDAGPGWQCESNSDCAAGCFCNEQAWCEEAGFCAVDTDCVGDFVCDERSSCVPPEPIEPEPDCEDLSDDEAACLDRVECTPVYRGVNCTSSDGTECSENSESCSCESFTLDRCEDLIAP